MKQKITTANILKLVVIIIILFGGAHYIQAFGPNCTPPLCNADFPLNSSSTAQTKDGPLTVNQPVVFQGQLANNSGPANYGLIITNGRIVFGATTSPSSLKTLINGNVGSTQYCDTDGNNCYTASQVENIINNSANISNGETLTCPSTPNYDSMGSTGVSAKPVWSSVAIPDGCFDDAGCVIKQVMYKDSNTVPYRVRQYSFNQDTTSNRWWSSYSQSGSKINGDSNSNSVITSIWDGNYSSPTYYLLLRDDHSGTETDASHWSAYDNSATRGQKIYICTYAPDTGN